MPRKPLHPHDACARIGAGEGGLALALTDPDRSNLFFTLDKDHTNVAVFFSKSSRMVTGIELIIKPSLRSPRITHSWLAAKRVQLNADRSYSVRFAPPLTDEEREELRKNRPEPQYPPPPTRN